MGARQSSSCGGAHRQQDEEDPPPPYPQTEGGTNPFLHQGGPGAIAPRLSPFGNEIQDAAPPTSRPTLVESRDKTLSTLNRQRERQHNSEMAELEYIAAQQKRIFAALLDRSLDVEDAARPLTVSLRRAHARLARAEAQLATLQRELKEAAILCSSLESKLHSTQARLEAVEVRAASAEARARALEKEKQHIVAVAASVKQRLELIESGKQSLPPMNSGSHGLTKSRYRVERRLTLGLGASDRD